MIKGMLTLDELRDEEDEEPDTIDCRLVLAVVRRTMSARRDFPFDLRLDRSELRALLPARSDSPALSASDVMTLKARLLQSPASDELRTRYSRRHPAESGTMCE